MKFSLNNLKAVAQYNALLEKRVAYVQESYVNDLTQELYESTPKDTGAAASSWTASREVPIGYFSLSRTSGPTKLKRSGKIARKLFVSTGCPYMRRLNYRIF